MTIPDTDAAFVITRLFNAPIDRVFETMTETEHLKKWWGPKGCTIEVARNEPHTGGVFHYRLLFPGGFDMWGKFQYREIAAPARIVFINGFADANGNTVPNPMSPSWPLEVLNTATLEEQGDKTAFTLRAQPINASELERMTFLAGHASLQLGCDGMYDQYEKYLSTL